MGKEYWHIMRLYPYTSCSILYSRFNNGRSAFFFVRYFQIGGLQNTDRSLLNFMLLHMFERANRYRIVKFNNEYGNKLKFIICNNIFVVKFILSFLCGYI